MQMRILFVLLYFTSLSVLGQKFTRSEINELEKYEIKGSLLTFREFLQMPNDGNYPPQIETNLNLAIDNLTNPVKLDSGIALRFVLKGFGDSAGFDVSDMLSSGIFGYRRPYLLNN